MTDKEEIVVTAAQNIVSYTGAALMFRWTDLIPQPDRVIEWAAGLFLVATISIYNIVKTRQILRGKHKDKDD